MRSILILVVMLWTASLVAAERSSDSLNQIRVLPQLQQTAQAYYAQIAGRTSNWEQNLFPPELVMRHRAELELTDKQRSDLIAMIQQFQSAMVPVEWELQDAKVELEKILAKYPTPEKAVEQALDNVFIHEAQIKLRSDAGEGEERPQPNTDRLFAGENIGVSVHQTMVSKGRLKSRLASTELARQPRVPGLNGKSASGGFRHGCNQLASECICIGEAEHIRDERDKRFPSLDVGCLIDDHCVFNYTTSDV